MHDTDNAGRPKIHWITPVLPTILNGRDALPIPGTDLIFASLDGVWIVPWNIDVQKLKSAIAYALHDYPHAAGRLCCTDRIWSVYLSNLAVPLTVGTSDLILNEELMVERHPDFVDRIPYGFEPPSNLDEPLVRFKLVTYPRTGETSLSLSWSHVLGDGLTLFRFMNTIHHHYLSLPAPPAPTFEKFIHPPPPLLPRALLIEMLQQMPHLAVDYAHGDFARMYADMLDATERVDLQFSAVQLRAISAVAHGNASSGGLSMIQPCISTQDALVAYLISVLDRVQPSLPITRIMNVIDYRGVLASPHLSSYTPPSQNAAGNITLTCFSPRLPAPVAGPSSQLRSWTHALHPLATAVRATVTQARSPTFVHHCVALSEELYLRSANAGRLQWWFPYPVDPPPPPATASPNTPTDPDGAFHPGSTVAVNNLSRVPFTSLHFRADAGASSAAPLARFYTFDSWENYFRLFPGNPPAQRGDPAAAPEDVAGSVRTFFRVRRALRTRVLRTVAEDMHALAQVSPVDVLERTKEKSVVTGGSNGARKADARL